MIDDDGDEDDDDDDHDCDYDHSSTGKPELIHGAKPRVGCAMSTPR